LPPTILDQQSRADKKPGGAASLKEAGTGAQPEKMRADLSMVQPKGYLCATRHELPTGREINKINYSHVTHKNIATL